MKINKLVATTLGAGLIVAGLGVSSPADAATAKLRITKVFVNSPGSDRGGNASINGEYVVIKNTGRTAVSMKGYSLRDETNHVYRFGSFTLKAGKTVKVYSGKGSGTSSTRYMGQSWYVWNNTGGDSATLRNAGGKKVAYCDWDNVDDYTTC